MALKILIVALATISFMNVVVADEKRIGNAIYNGTLCMVLAYILKIF